MLRSQETSHFEQKRLCCLSVVWFTTFHISVTKRLNSITFYGNLFLQSTSCFNCWRCFSIALRFHVQSKSHAHKVEEPNLQSQQTWDGNALDQVSRVMQRKKSPSGSGRSSNCSSTGSMPQDQIKGASCTISGCIILRLSPGLTQRAYAIAMFPNRRPISLNLPLHPHHCCIDWLPLHQLRRI